MTNKTIKGILVEYRIGFVVGDKNVNKHFKEFEQAITQAILDALPEKVDGFSDVNNYDEAYQGYNQAISEMESAIKKIGDK